MHFLQQEGSSFIVLILSTVLAVIHSSSWDPDMPGGMKLVIDGETYSFTTNVCSGGVFFKAPVHIQLTCLHGYFLARPNGCSIAGNSVLGGQNYVCQRVNKDKSNLVQALIPVTNPDSPLDHTLTLFDRPDTLENLRRYTYVQVLEGNYTGMGSNPAGAIVANGQKTPDIGIGSLCYEGQAQHSALAYMALIVSLLSNVETIGNGQFRQGCGADSVKLPTGGENVYNFTQGYSDPNMFEGEMVAKLAEGTSEIWGGLAYCLQADVKVSDEGKISMQGLSPSIESLAALCPENGEEDKSVGTRRGARDVREKRGVTSSPAFDTLMACVSTCWKENPDKCHQPFPETFRLPLCPPYCGGKYRHHVSLPIRPRRSAAWGGYGRSHHPVSPPIRSSHRHNYHLVPPRIRPNSRSHVHPVPPPIHPRGGAFRAYPPPVRTWDGRP